MNRKHLEKGMEENGRELADLLAALPRVEAPANFDFGVKARIAAGGPKRRSAIFPFLKVAVPLSLVLLIGAFVFFYGTMPGADTPDVAIGSNSISEPARVAKTEERAAQEPPESVSAPQVAEPGEREVLTASARPRKTTGRGLANSVSSDIRDYKINVTPANVICPRGIPCAGNSNTLSNSNASQGSDVSVREILEFLGMKVDVVKGKWTVSSTAANSIAERSSVLANDVVESINDQAIGGKSKLKGKVEAKVLTIGRDGKSIKLDLKH